MKPIKQTIFGQGMGNCFAACIASVLERDLEDVPNFCVDFPEDEWCQKTNEWLSQYGVGLVWFTDGPATLEAVQRQWPDAYVLVGGPTERGTTHSVVYRGGQMVHDPHPSDDGLVAIDDVTLFVLLDPARTAPPVRPLRELEQEAIDAALREAGGSVGKAAKLLGIGRATLYRKLAQREKAA